MTRRAALTVLAFACIAGAIAYGVMVDVHETRLTTLLDEVTRAEKTVVYDGTREIIKQSHTVVLRMRGQGDQRDVEFVRADGFSRSKKSSRRRRGGWRGASFGSFPSFLKPGHGQWKNTIKDSALAVRNFDIRREGREPFAGREAEVVSFTPRHSGRATYRAWVDSENRFLLGFRVRRDGDRVFETRFTEIEFPAVLPEDPFSRRSGRWGRSSWIKVDATDVPAAEISGRADFDVWFPARVPPGFELRGSQLVTVKVDVPKEMRALFRGVLPDADSEVDVQVAHLNYTDGLAVLSVVECASDSALWKLSKRFLPGVNGERRGDEVVARKMSDRGGSAYVMDVGGTVILVSGNVPSGEIEEMIRTFEKRS